MITADIFETEKSEMENNYDLGILIKAKILKQENWFFKIERTTDYSWVIYSVFFLKLWLVKKKSSIKTLTQNVPEEWKHLNVY